jgi:hypothetical protein
MSRAGALGPGTLSRSIEALASDTTYYLDRMRLMPMGPASMIR